MPLGEECSAGAACKRWRSDGLQPWGRSEEIASIGPIAGEHHRADRNRVVERPQ